MTSPPTARAAVFVGPGQPLTLRQFPLPELHSGDILVRVTCCTLCSSDLHSYTGRRSVPTPSILGHEILGRIASFGPGACRQDIAGQTLNEGDRVTWSVAANCGGCFFCRNHIPQKCDRLFKYGHEPLDSRSPLSGGLAEYCVLQPGTAVVRVPEDLDNRLVCPASCATATVAAALRAAGGCAGKTILILGAGVLGLTACAMAQSQGAHAVICCDIDQGRAEKASLFGASQTCLADEGSLRPILEGQTEGRGADVAVELAGSAEAVELGPRLLRIGGTLVLVGTVFPTRPAALEPERIVRRLLTIRGVHNYAPEDLHQALEFLVGQRDREAFKQMVSATFPLEKSDAAFQHALLNPGMRVAVEPGG